ncbi:anti-repressor SinI family protein [Brevibacillus choshinensis]|nr:anti-repressor SinI family protein [Brevibacillus choshinensis]
MFAKEFGTEEIDYEWKELIVEAKNLGISKEDIRNFLLLAAKDATAQR